MTKVSIGIDIAKDWVDVAVLDLDNQALLHEERFEQNNNGYQRLIGSIASFEVVHLVLEATGVYHLHLTQALLQAHLPVSVINPLQLRRFAQMKLRRAKTDRVDAVLLAQYGPVQRPPLHEMRPAVQGEIMQLHSHIALLIKIRTMLLNARHAQKKGLTYSGISARVMEAHLAYFEQAIAELEAEQDRLAELAFAPVRDLILSIPGIGRRTMMVLLAYLGDLSSFERASQLSAYMGLNPKVWESGHWRGQVHISKQGNATLRQLLYLCALSAVRSNPPCRRMYERLRGRGSSAKAAYIAVANKLLRQLIAVVHSGVAYDPDYEAKRCLIT